MPSPPQTRMKSTLRLNARAFSQRETSIPAARAVASSHHASRPLFVMSLTASRTTLREETLPELAMMPTRSNDAGDFFNQSEEFFVACRTKKWRFSDAPPKRARKGSGKLLYLIDHPFMHERIGDHTGAAIDL